MERVQDLESTYGRELIILEPGLFQRERTKLLRGGLQEEGSLCLRCHDVFKETQEDAKNRRLDYRVLY